MRAVREMKFTPLHYFVVISITFRRTFMGFCSKGIIFTGVFVCIFSGFVFGGEKFISEIDRTNQTFIKADQDGEIWSAYFDTTNGVHIHNAGKGKDLVVNSGGDKSRSGLVFDIRKEHLFVAWREKAEGKKIFFRASHDNGKTLSEPVLLDDGKTDPLPRMVMGSNTKGNIVVEWVGERKTGEDKYHLNAVCSNDFGNTFSKPQNLTLGYDHSIYPALFVDDRGTYVFSYSTRGGKRYMLFRRSSDGCKTWSDLKEIKEIGVVTLFVEPVRVGNRLHVYWFNNYEGSGYVVEGAYSDDDGLTWKTTLLESTRGFDTGLMRVASDSRGHIYIALHGKKGADKQSVYLVRSEDNGATWSEMIPLRHYSSKDTKAEHLIVRAEDDGTVVAVWHDYRNIRNNLYMQYSRDYGKTWQEKDFPLEEPGRFNTGYFPYTNEIIKVKDKYYLLANRFKSDVLGGETANLLLLDFTLDKGGKEK
jgi:hypothetical protein